MADLRWADLRCCTKKTHMLRKDGFLQSANRQPYTFYQLQITCPVGGKTNETGKRMFVQLTRGWEDLLVRAPVEPLFGKGGVIHWLRFRAPPEAQNDGTTESQKSDDAQDHCDDDDRGLVAVAAGRLDGRCGKRGSCFRK